MIPIDPAVVAVAVAVNVTTRSASALLPIAEAAPATVAVSVFVPAEFPSRQLPTVAIPDASVVCVGPVIDPPPVATAKVTVTP